MFVICQWSTHVALVLDFVHIMYADSNEIAWISNFKYKGLYNNVNMKFGSKDSKKRNSYNCK